MVYFALVAKILDICAFLFTIHYKWFILHWFADIGIIIKKWGYCIKIDFVRNDSSLGFIIKD